MMMSVDEKKVIFTPPSFYHHHPSPSFLFETFISFPASKAYQGTFFQCENTVRKLPQFNQILKRNQNDPLEKDSRVNLETCLSINHITSRQSLTLDEVERTAPSHQYLLTSDTSVHSQNKVTTPPNTKFISLTSPLKAYSCSKIIIVTWQE